MKINIIIFSVIILSQNVFINLCKILDIINALSRSSINVTWFGTTISHLAQSTKYFKAYLTTLCWFFLNRKFCILLTNLIIICYTSPGENCLYVVEKEYTEILYLVAVHLESWFGHEKCKDASRKSSPFSSFNGTTMDETETKKEWKKIYQIHDDWFQWDMLDSVLVKVHGV